MPHQSYNTPPQKKSIKTHSLVLRRAYTTSYLVRSRPYKVTRLSVNIELTRTRSEHRELSQNFNLNLEQIQKRIALNYQPNRTIRKRLGLLRVGIITKLGRKERKKIALTTATIEQSNQVVARMQEADENVGYIRTDSLTPITPAPNGDMRLRGSQGTIYRPGLRFEHGGVLYYQETPPRQQSVDLTPSVEFDEAFSHTFFNDKQTDTDFSFIVTIQGIHERSGVKRPCSQKQLANGYSAADIFRAMGILFDEKFSRYFHLAHRIGWGLGGPQIKENIDPATAGSNYTTLFFVEDVIRNILVKGHCDEVHVGGNIEYHPDFPKLPIKITYTWHWFVGNERHEMSKDIFPLNPRRPTIQENEYSRALSDALSYTPQYSKEHSADESIQEDLTDDRLVNYAPPPDSTPIGKSVVESENDENNPLLANVYSTPSSPQFFKPSKISIVRSVADDPNLQKGQKTFAQWIKEEEEEERRNRENNTPSNF